MFFPAFLPTDLQRSGHKENLAKNFDSVET